MRPTSHTPHLPAPSTTQTSQSDANTRNISSSVVSGGGLGGLPARSVGNQCYNCGITCETNSNYVYNCRVSIFIATVLLSHADSVCLCASGMPLFKYHGEIL